MDAATKSLNPAWKWQYTLIWVLVTVGALIAAAPAVLDLPNGDVLRTLGLCIITTSVAAQSVLRSLHEGTLTGGTLLFVMALLMVTGAAWGIAIYENWPQLVAAMSVR